MEWAIVFAAIVSALATAFIAALTVAILKTNRQYVKVSEAMQKPHVTPQTELLGPSDPTFGRRPFVIRVAHTVNVLLVNVGMGPALDVRYDFRQLDLQEGQPHPDRSGFDSYIMPGEEAQTAVPWTALKNHPFELSLKYRSLSRRRYRVKILIEDTVIKPKFGKAPDADRLSPPQAKL